MGVEIRVSKEQITGFKCPPGEYEFRFDGWHPQFSKDRLSHNLWPELVIINHGTLNGKKIPMVCNTQSGWEHIELMHSLGVGEPSYDTNSPDYKTIPGEFEPDVSAPDDPKKWRYIEDPNQPILGQIGRCVVVEVAHYKRPGDTQSAVKKLFCRLPGCRHEHRESLVSSS